MPTIQTPRLHLVALDHKQLKHYSDAPVRLLQEFGLKVTFPKVSTSFNAEMDHAMRTRWLPDTLAYPDLYPWYTNWLIVHTEDKISIGTIGLGGYPNDHGETTIGYMIGEQYRGKGYATEALSGMISWAFAFSALQVIKADTNTSNLASQRVLVNAGFFYTHTDEYDKHYQLTRGQATQHTNGS